MINFNLDLKRTDQLGEALELAATARTAQQDYLKAAEKAAPVLQKALDAMLDAHRKHALAKAAYARLLSDDGHGGNRLIGDVQRAAADTAALHTIVPGAPKMVIDAAYSLPSTDPYVQLLHKLVQQRITEAMANEHGAKTFAWFQQRYTNTDTM